MLALAEYFNVAWVLIGGVVVFGAIQIWRLRDGVTYGIIIAVAIYNFQIRIVILACLRIIVLGEEERRSERCLSSDEESRT